MRRRRILFVLTSAVLFAASTAASAQSSRPARLGMRTRIEALVLPGPELVAKPVVARSPIVLRITATYPHGTDFRYDLEFEGLEPGGFDLRDWLVRKSGEPAAGLPPIGVEVSGLLPPGRVVPHAPTALPPPSVGGYFTTLVVLGLVWLGGVVWFVVSGRRRRPAAAAPPPVPVSLAERLRPMVEAAAAGSLPPAERARLELGLLALWRRRLGLADRSPAEIFVVLKDHPEAGPLLRGLESWLHAPDAAGKADVGDLLAPYRGLPASIWDADAPVAGRG